jgi:disulfide bond formation protein DsbB
MEIILAYATLVGHVVLVALLLLGFARKTTKKNIAKSLWGTLKENAVALALLTSLAATLGSLYYSYILGFEPCLFCWYQRIAMFPLVAVLAIGMWKNFKNVTYFAAPLALFGTGVATYQVLLQKTASSALAALAPCSIDAVDCAVPYVTYFGYINIPVMSLTAFLFILYFLWMAHKN